MRVVLLLLVLGGIAGAAYLGLTTENYSDLLGLYDAKGIGFIASVVIAVLAGLLLVLGVGRKSSEPVSAPKKAKPEAAPAEAVAPPQPAPEPQPEPAAVPEPEPSAPAPMPEQVAKPEPAIEEAAAPAPPEPVEAPPVAAAPAAVSQNEEPADEPNATEQADVKALDRMVTEARKSKDPEAAAEAIQGYIDALQAAPPTDWAQRADLNSKLGNALLAKARLDRDTQDAQAAIEAFESAIAATARMDPQTGMAERLQDLATAQNTHFQFSKDDSMVDAACQSFAAAAEVAERDNDIRLMGQALNGQARAMLTIGRKHKDAATLRKSLDVSRKAIACGAPDTRQRIWVDTLEGAALTKEALAKLGDEPDRHIAEAVSHIEAVLREIPDLKPPPLKNRLERHLERLSGQVGAES